MKKILEIMLKEANKALSKKEIPVSALIVINDEIIAKGHNKREITNYITDHAEIIAIKKAAKILGSWKMPNAILYSTLEPCEMCEAAIKQSRIKKVIYFSKQDKKINYKLNKEFINKSFAKKLLQEYFKKLR